jgi:hypothetical protein
MGNVVSKGFYGNAIATFDNSTMHLRGQLTKCSVDVYLGGLVAAARSHQ